ncbi:MAG: hypothetical protein RLZZ66_1284 [Pseudomonadota bacterium]|jgi:hypothetical protein
MAINFYGSTYQGFNFKRDNQDRLGYVTALTIGETEFTADFATLVNPEDFTEEYPAVGVISSCTWGAGDAEPIHLSFQVSTVNKNLLKGLLMKSMINTTVEIGFECWDYDHEAKVYFKTFHTGDDAVNGMVLKSGGALRIAVADDNDPSVPNPQNFTLNLSVMPASESQALQWAASSDSPQAFKWGTAG